MRSGGRELTAEHCPECAEPLARPAEGSPWCAGCEWNLDSYPTHRVVALGGGWLDRLDFRLAFRRDLTTFAEMAGTPPQDQQLTVSSASVVLVLMSAVLIATDVACFVVAARLLMAYGVGLGLLLSVPLIGLGVLMRPRLGRLPHKEYRLHRAVAPSLHALVDRVAAELGTPAPDIIAVDFRYNASTRRAGLRQRRILTIGLPLWITLPPSARVALLAHELGHNVNGDPTRGLLVRPALTTFAVLARTSGIDRSLEDAAYSSSHAYSQVAQMLIWLASRIFAIIHLAITALAAPDHQRAEYRADAMSVRVAGTEGTLAVLERLTLAPQLRRAIHHSAEIHPPEAWAGLAASLRESRSSTLDALHQLTRRNTSLWRSHPPSGLRVKIVRNWPHTAALVELSDKTSAAIEEELGSWYAALHGEILGTRTYRRSPQGLSG
jgi:heat shock protein HtpX